MSGRGRRYISASEQQRILGVNNDEWHDLRVQYCPSRCLKRFAQPLLRRLYGNTAKKNLVDSLGALFFGPTESSSMTVSLIAITEDTSKIQTAAPTLKSIRY